MLGQAQRNVPLNKYTSEIPAKPRSFPVSSLNRGYP